MKLIIFTLVTILLLIGCGAETVEPTATPAPTAASAETDSGPDLTILAFGDSLTAGFGVAENEAYPAQLERKLLADDFDVQVINGGISGETSSSALSRVDWMLQTEPDVVIVETGANDALRGVDLALTKTNIDRIVEQFTAAGVTVVVAGMQITQNLGDDYINEFADIYPAVAEQHGAILIPFVLEGVAADPELNQDDFIHPTAEGYTVMVNHIYPFILEALE